METKNEMTRERAELIKFITSHIKVIRKPYIPILLEADVLSGKVKPPNRPYILLYST